LPSSSKCSTTGGDAKNGPTMARHSRKQRAAAEVHGVVFQRVPEDLQDVAFRAFDALVHLPAAKALRLADATVVSPRWMASSKAACWPGWMRMSASSRITARFLAG
jgi:hypothetical protein